MNIWLKDIAQWQIGKTLYLSVVFSWDIERAAHTAKKHNGPVIVGGPAAILNREVFDGVAEVREFCEVAEPLLMHNPLATFTTRGCVNQCEFCSVPKTEGGLVELTNWRPAPLVCDNNFLAASTAHQRRVINTLRHFPLVDFNQGLDARLLTAGALDNLARLKAVKLRFAFDHINLESQVADAVALCQRRGLHDIAVYVLIGFKDTPTDALYRLRKTVEWGCLPCPMRYQPLDTNKKDSYVGTNWTGTELRRMMRYFWKYRFHYKTPYEEFRPPLTKTLF